MEHAWIGIPEKRNFNNNPFCYSNHKLYIKYGKQTCHFVLHSKFKQFDYVKLFKRQEQIDALTEIISFSTVAQTKIYTKSSKSVKNASHEASGQIASVNESQENEYSSDVMSN